MKLKILTTKQAAERLGVSVRRVQELVASGKLTTIKLGREYAIEEGALSGVKVYRKPGRPPKKAAAKKARKAKAPASDQVPVIRTAASANEGSEGNE